MRKRLILPSGDGMSFLFEKIGKKNLYIAAFLIGSFVFFRYLMPLCTPFLLAFFLVYLTYPWLSAIEKRSRIPKEFLLGGILAAIALFLVFLLCLAGEWCAGQIEGIGSGLEAAGAQMQLFLRDCCGYMEGKLGVDALVIEQAVMERVNVFVEEMQVDVLPKLAQGSVLYGKKLLSAGAVIGISFISSLLLCKDYAAIMEKLERFGAAETALRMLQKIVDLIAVFLKAQFLILCVIGLVCCIGLWIAKVPGGPVLGILAGVLDALPFIGTGIVLVPTALWQFINGNAAGGVICLALYVLCIALREMLEPKLMGKQVGVMPVVMLFAVYAGVKLFGVSGLIKGPLLLVLLREGVEWIRGRMDSLG